MLELLAVLGVIYYLGKKYGDEVGATLIGILAVVMICLMISGFRSGGKAIGNWVEYWKNEPGDGPGDKRNHDKRIRK